MQETLYADLGYSMLGYVRLLTILGLLVSLPNIAFSGPIYVYRESDGVIRFSSKAPPKGTQAKVFSAKESKYSVYRSTRSSRSKLFPNLYSSHIASSARKYRVGRDLIQAVIHAESAFNPRAVSPKGALGLMQLMPFNARRYGAKDPFSPKQNIDAGVRMLAMLNKKYRGDIRLVLAAYNAGEGAVERYGGVPPYRETQNYVRKVMSLKQRYSVAR